MTEKACTSCKIVKEIGEFYSKGKRVDSSCKECIKIRKRVKIVAKSAPVPPATNFGENIQKPVKIEIDRDQLRDSQAIRTNLSSFFHLAFDLRRECSQKLLRSLESNHEVK